MIEMTKEYFDMIEKSQPYFNKSIIDESTKCYGCNPNSDIGKYFCVRTMNEWKELWKYCSVYFSIIPGVEVKYLNGDFGYNEDWEFSLDEDTCLLLSGYIEIDIEIKKVKHSDSLERNALAFAKFLSSCGSFEMFSAVL